MIVLCMSLRNRITIIMEKESILKEGFQLTWKSLFPKSVKMLNWGVFDKTTVAVPEVLWPQTDTFNNWKGTTSFINITVEYCEY